MKHEPTATPRGACPTLTAPMPVTDGLLARFVPARGLGGTQIAALAEAAQRYGNGRIEVTARGSVQIRGLSRDSQEDFRHALDRAGIEARTGVTIDRSPIAGEDPDEIRDPRPLIGMIEAACMEALARGALSPKLSIVIDAGGQIPLDALKADIRLLARPQGWEMVAGRAVSVLFDEAGAADATARLLDRLQAAGPRARVADLAPEHIPHPPAQSSPSPHPPRATSRGPMRLKGHDEAIRIGLPYGQVTAVQLGRLAMVMDDHGIAEARPAPDRTLVLIGARAGTAPALAAAGFAIGANERPSLCSGAEASTNGIIHAADLARAMAHAVPDLADGSFHLHVSTCAKGCAHAGRPGIVLADDGLAIYRGAAQRPFARLDPAAIEAGIVSLATRIRDIRRPGETVLECLERHDAI